MVTDLFASRHIGIRKDDLPKMLQTIGVESIDQLIDETIPGEITLKKPLDLSSSSLPRVLSKKQQLCLVYLGACLPRLSWGMYAAFFPQLLS